jgi:hypothetical protein
MSSSRLRSSRCQRCCIAPLDQPRILTCNIGVFITDSVRPPEHCLILAYREKRSPVAVQGVRQRACLFFNVAYCALLTEIQLTSWRKNEASDDAPAHPVAPCSSRLVRKGRGISPGRCCLNQGVHSSSASEIEFCTLYVVAL